jgi:hypothetical protein
MWMTVLASAFAAPAEEIIVLADPFARLDSTRWVIETRVVHPTGWELMATENLGAWVHVVELDALLTCDQDSRLGRERMEVSCVIDEVAVRAQPRTLGGSSTRLQRLLTAIDERLTGAAAQLLWASGRGRRHPARAGYDAPSSLTHRHERRRPDQSLDHRRCSPMGLWTIAPAAPSDRTPEREEEGCTDQQKQRPPPAHGVHECA